MNAAIAKAVIKIVGDGGYEPAGSTAAMRDQFPKTMRELIESDEIDPYGDSDARFALQTGHLDRSAAVLMPSPCPVSLRDLTRRRPKRPHGVCVDAGVLYWQPFCQAAQAWLAEHKQPPEIDHPLTGDPMDWPVVKAFEGHLKEISNGITLECLFGDLYNEPFFSAAYLPLYNIDSETDDYVVLLEFLDNNCLFNDDVYDFNMPEIFIETCEKNGQSVVQIHTVTTVFHNILIKKQFDFMDEPWAAALRVLSEYNYPYISVGDYDQCRVDLEPSVAGFDCLLIMCRDVGAMIDVVDPLIRDCNADAERFWSALAVRLNELVQTRPHLTAIPERKKARVKV
ncbi:MAG: hypothetical protein DRP56_01040 [Planctomycetota bacterium]|nr:MAG: hypothetical protein DRP56_01040 [Planctomycetota bacterium]